MELNDRLEILLSSNTITKDVYDKVKLFISRLEDKWDIKLTEENGGRLITHLSMALMRIARNENIAPMDEEALGEFRASGYFSKALTIVDDLIDIAGLQVPSAERDYLISNVCLILED